MNVVDPIIHQIFFISISEASWTWVGYSNTFPKIDEIKTIESKTNNNSEIILQHLEKPVILNNNNEKETLLIV